MKPGAWRLKKRHDKGCANLRRKTERWLVDLVKEGCTAAVVLHDLDLNPQNGSLNDEAALRHKLAEVLELEQCRKKCRAFADLHSFVTALAPA